MLRSPLAQWLKRCIGLGIIGLALWFLVRELTSNWTSIGGWRPSRANLLTLLFLSLCYGASLFLLAESWHRIVCGFGDEARRRTYLSLTATQIARYLPGNIAHILGRAMWLRNGPLTDGDLLRATAIEILVTPTGAVLALLLLSPVITAHHFLLSDFTGYAASLLMITGIFVLFSRASAYSGKTGQWVRKLRLPMLLSTVFMLFLGAIFAIILNIVDTSPPATAMTAAIIAWVVGYITPGVPGGLGVREAALVLLVSGSTGADMVVLASILLRIVTTMGELCCFAAGWFIHRRNADST